MGHWRTRHVIVSRYGPDHRVPPPHTAASSNMSILINLDNNGEVDVHQHLLSEPADRRAGSAAQATGARPPPRRLDIPGRRRARQRALVRCDDVGLRTAELRREEIDLALVALSTALGVETLPAEEAAPLLEAYEEGFEELSDGFGGWGAVQLEAPDPDEVDAAIAPGPRRHHPAGGRPREPRCARAGRAAARAARNHDAPLFVHPGPVARPARRGQV